MKDIENYIKKIFVTYFVSSLSLLSDEILTAVKGKPWLGFLPLIIVWVVDKIRHLPRGIRSPPPRSAVVPPTRMADKMSSLAGKSQRE